MLYIRLRESKTMKISYYLDEKSKVFLEVYEGDLNLNKLIDCWNSFWKHPKFNPDYHLLMDARAINMGLKFDETLKLSHLINESKIGFRSKIAVLVSDPKIAVQADLYGEVTKKVQSLKVFTYEDEALEYVGSTQKLLDRKFECIYSEEG